MYIDRLAYYEKQKIIAEVSMCLGGDNNEKHANLYVSPDFPLVDLLYQLYQTALYNSMLSPENDIITRIKHYREQIDKSFNYSFEDLIKLGWVDTCFGHHMIIGHRKSGRDEIFRNESMKCADQDILRFIFWEDERQQDSYFFIKREDAVALIAKWQQVSDKVQNLNWFCELDILCDCGEKIVISSGARYKDCITQAMGRLWNDICDEDDFVTIAPKWLQLAAQTRIDSNVLGYIDDRKNQEYRNRLLSLVVSAIRTDSRYVSGEIEHRKTINTFRFDNAHNLTMVMEHKEVYSFKEHRALRKKLGFISDDFFWQNHQRWGDNFYLGIVVASMRFLDGNDYEDIFDLLKVYADSGRLKRSYVNIHPNELAEMLMHKETFFFATIKLVENIRPFEQERTGITNHILDLFKKIFEIYQKSINQPTVEDMLDLLLYIVERSKTSVTPDNKDNQFLVLYNKLTDIYLSTGLAKQLIAEAPVYFNRLMKYDHRDVDFGRCIYLLFRFTDCVITSDNGEGAAVNALCDEAYHGICKILTEKGRWSHFIDTECFSEALSKRIYLSHILGLTENKKRKVIGVDFETEERMDLVYRYKVAIVFLTKAGYGIEDARLKLQQYLQIIMIERKKLDYSSISIFGMEKLLRDAFALLEDHKETSESFFKSLLRSELPELILCTGLLRDEEIIEAFIEEIKERVAEADDTDELLPGFNDERLIDIVLDRRIKCLYSFVQKRLDYKLERYRKRGNIERNRYYFIAYSQRKSLIYIRGDIREIVKTHDQFLIAAFKTENIESPSDYTEAVQLWKNYLNSINRGDDSYSACYNYLYAIYLTIEKSSKTESPIMVDSHAVKTFKTDFQWIIDFSVKDGMAHWGIEQQEKFFDLLMRTGVKLNTDAEYIYTYIKECTRLKIDEGKAISIVAKIIKEQADNPEGSIGIVIKYEVNKDDEDIIAALQKYYARSLEEKTKLMAKSRAAVEDGKNWYGVFALKTVITACKILRKSVPYFVGRVKSEKQGKGEQIQVPPEDHISILFRECYNMAYQEMFGVHVDDQSKIGTTGNLLTDKKLPSPAEVDMAISYGMHTHELFEAFILKSSTETTVFRDHMGKVMGNNCDFCSPVFMLVYTFEERAKNKQKWSKYREYLEKGFEQDYKDVENGTGIKSRLADIEDSDCYIHSFNYGLNELDFIRQVVTIDENDVEIIHILIDMSLSIQRDIRKSS